MNGGINPFGYVQSQPTTLIDPFGLADLNLFNPDPKGGDASVNYEGGNNWNIPGVYTIAGHGNPGNMADNRRGNFIPIWPDVLANMVKSDPKWKGRPIMLGSCHTGKSWPQGFGGKTDWIPFAQSLANYLGVPVTSPLEFAYFDKKLGLWGAGETRPLNQGEGTWKTFFPSK